MYDHQTYRTLSLVNSRFWIQELRCRSTEAEGTFEAPVTTHTGDKGALVGGSGRSDLLETDLYPP